MFSARPRTARRTPSTLPLRPLVLALAWACGSAAATELPLAADTYVSSAAPNANYGATVTLNVGNGAMALLRFDLASLPERATPSELLKATLVLYVNRVGVPGAVEVQTLGSAWSESAVTAATVPVNERSGSAPAAAVTGAGQYISIDVTDKVLAWIAAGSAGNFGLSVQAAASEPATVVFFDSKENTGTGHAARLDITLANQGPAGPQGAPGAPGPAGSVTGVTGPAGPAGPQGPKGDTGPAGAAGAAGPAGPAGLAGPAGPKGETGAAGPAGPRGDTGPAGPSGPDGAVGLAGPAGPAGPAGLAGPVGAAGATGAVGPQGPVGPSGATGAIGPAGPSGPAGPQGLAGPAGPAGPTGATGPAGAQGLAGPAGARGPAGPQGAPGAPGADGAVPGFGTTYYGASAGDGAVCTMGQLTLSAASLGVGLPADGRLLTIAGNTALFSLLGTAFGGDGRTTFALPNLRSVAPNGLTYYICDRGVYPSRR